MRILWKVVEEALADVVCGTLTEAKQYVEDRAAEVWGAIRDPNVGQPQAYPGLDWSFERANCDNGTELVRVGVLRGTGAAWKIGAVYEAH